MTYIQLAGWRNKSRHVIVELIQTQPIHKAHTVLNWPAKFRKNWCLARPTNATQKANGEELLNAMSVYECHLGIDKTEWIPMEFYSTASSDSDQAQTHTVQLRVKPPLSKECFRAKSSQPSHDWLA